MEGKNLFLAARGSQYPNSEGSATRPGGENATWGIGEDCKKKGFEGLPIFSHSDQNKKMPLLRNVRGEL